METANLSLTTEMVQVLDQRQVWFTNLLLLGFDPVAQEDKTKVRFCREMFCHINKKGMEVTLHYLFSRLDSHLAYEEFRDCWPVYDKKQEAQFRKVCVNWLTRIAKEEPESKLPRLSASLLMSPGGDRFDQLMLRLTTYVLRVVCLREAKGEEKKVFLSSFVTSPESLRSSTNRHILRRALQCHVIRHSRSVASRLELATALHEQWRQFASHQVSEYRSLAKEKRELEAQIKAAISSSHSEGKSSSSTPTADRVRKNKMKTVRGFWKSVEEFQSKTVHEREVMDAITKGNGNKYTINAKDLQFQVPDMILHMYEALLREGKAGNTYEAGKLNLLSLLQLWNCALQVMRDRFRESELPSFQAESKHMSEVLQAHRVNLAASQNLRASLMEYQHSLQDSIEQLEQELQALRASSSQSEKHKDGVGEENKGEEKSGAENGLPPPPQLYIPPITLPAMDLGLLPPSPQKSHRVSSPDMQHLHSHLSHLSLPNDAVSTPEAVHNISESIQRASRSQKPKHAYPHSSSIPRRIHTASPVTDESGERWVEFGASGRESSEMVRSSAKSTRRERKSAQTAKSQAERFRTPPSSSHGSGVQHRPVKAETTPSSQTGTSRKTQGRSRRTESAKAGVHVGDGGGSVYRKTSLNAPCTQSPQITPTHPRLLDTMPAAHDLLAGQIASAVADSFQLYLSPHTPEQLHSLTDPLSALGTEAFVSHDKIPRTPISKQESSPLAAVIQQATPSHTPVTPTTITSHSTPTPTISPTITSHSTPSPMVTSHSTRTTTTTSHITPTPTTITTHFTPVSTVTTHTPDSTITTHSTPITTTHSTPITTSTTSQYTLHFTPHSATDNETLQSIPAIHSSALTISKDSLSPTSSPSPRQHTSPVSRAQSQSLLFGGSSDHFSSPPLLLLDSPAQLVSPRAPSTASLSFSSPRKTASFSSFPPSSTRVGVADVSHSEQLSQLGATGGSRISSPLINLSPSLPLDVCSTAKYVDTPTRAPSTSLGTSFPGFSSPAVKGLAPPLVGMPSLKSEQAQSPLIQFSVSSPLLHGSPVVLTPALTSGSPLQMSVGNITTPISTFGQVFGTPLHTTGGLLTTTHGHPIATDRASPLFAASPTDVSPSLSTTKSALFTPRESHGTPSVAASVWSSTRKTSEQAPTTPVSGVFTTPTQMPSFLLSSQPPTPFLHDLSSSEEGREYDEQKPSDLMVHSSDVGAAFQTGEGDQSFSMELEDENKTESRTSEETKPEGIPHGLQISSTPDEFTAPTSHLSPSTHITVSSSPHHGQLIDFSSPDEDWRPLDVSGEHLSSPAPSLDVPLTHPLKSEGVHHFSSNREVGLFDENDSFLVPLSPQSDHSLSNHEDAH